VFSLSTGSVINLPRGDKYRHLGEEVTTVGQQIAFWMDLGHRIGLNTFLGTDVPTGGEERKDADVDFQYGVALSKTIAINNRECCLTPYLPECRLKDRPPLFSTNYTAEQKTAGVLASFVGIELILSDHVVCQRNYV